MAWAWFFPAEKTLTAKIWSIFVMFSLEFQATDGKPRDVISNPKTRQCRPLTTDNSDKTNKPKYINKNSLPL